MISLIMSDKWREQPYQKRTNGNDQLIIFLLIVSEKCLPSEWSTLTCIISTECRESYEEREETATNNADQNSDRFSWDDMIKNE